MRFEKWEMGLGQTEDKIIFQGKDEYNIMAVSS
jgi:hypothetical protein